MTLGSFQLEQELGKQQKALEAVSVNIAHQGRLVTSAVDDATNRIEKSLAAASSQLAAALNRASAASEAHARNLAYATWALVVATVVLVVVTGLSLFK